MHASQDPRGAGFVEGLLYSFAILEEVQAQLYGCCVRIETSPRDAIPPAFWRCWSFIDEVHRLRQLAQGLPGFSQGRAELKTFLRETQLAEDFRHFRQHLRKELGKTQVRVWPVMGAVSWVSSTDPLVSKTVLNGANINGIEFGSLAFDRQLGRWVSRVALTALGYTFNFDPMYEACQRFRAFVEPWALSTYGLQGLIEPLIVDVRVGSNDGSPLEERRNSVG